MIRRVLVIYGGRNSEREVSLSTGKQCVHALRSSGHHVSEFDYTGDLAALLHALKPKPDVVFVALHGAFGEDGRLQGILEELDIPFTHSGRATSALAMNKAMTKIFVSGLGIQSPKSLVVRSQQSLHQTEIPLDFFPLVLKPMCGGSTVDSFRANIPEDLLKLEDVVDDDRLCEPHIPGREFTVAVLDDRALAVTEIAMEDPATMYDYHAKYQQPELHSCPASIERKMTRHLMSEAEKIHKSLACRGITRSDFRWDDRLPFEEGLYFLELNTHPGLTPVSLAPEQARLNNVHFDELLQRLLDSAFITRT